MKIETGGHRRRSDENNTVKYYCYRERLEKLELTTILERLRSDLIETFRIMKFRIMLNIFSLFFLELEIYSQDKKTKQNAVLPNEALKNNLYNYYS